MNNPLRRACTHPAVFIFRAHAKTYVEFHGQEAWIDEHAVYNYVRCYHCGDIIPAVTTMQRIYGQGDLQHDVAIETSDPRLPTPMLKKPTP